MGGEPDDGPTLSLSRTFRDRWMLASPQGRTLVAEYYAIAPHIVHAIPYGHSDWNAIAREIDYCAGAIKGGEPERAQALYVDMVRRATLHWLAPIV